MVPSAWLNVCGGRGRPARKPARAGRDFSGGRRLCLGEGLSHHRGDRLDGGNALSAPRLFYRLLRGREFSGNVAAASHIPTKSTWLEKSALTATKKNPGHFTLPGLLQVVASACGL